MTQLVPKPSLHASLEQWTQYVTVRIHGEILEKYTSDEVRAHCKAYERRWHPEKGSPVVVHPEVARVMEADEYATGAKVARERTCGVR